MEDERESDSQRERNKIRTRSETNKTKGADTGQEGVYSDEDEMSDDEEICVGIREPWIITKGPYVQTEQVPHGPHPFANVHPTVLPPDSEREKHGFITESVFSCEL